MSSGGSVGKSKSTNGDLRDDGREAGDDRTAPIYDRRRCQEYAKVEEGFLGEAVDINAKWDGVGECLSEVASFPGQFAHGPTRDDGSGLDGSICGIFTWSHV